VICESVFSFCVLVFGFAVAVVASIWSDYLTPFENRQQFFSKKFSAPMIFFLYKNQKARRAPIYAARRR
jgi:hypothetical protein